jgi:hypothetical protein
MKTTLIILILCASVFTAQASDLSRLIQHYAPRRYTNQGYLGNGNGYNGYNGWKHHGNNGYNSQNYYNRGYDRDGYRDGNRGDDRDGNRRDYPGNSAFGHSHNHPDNWNNHVNQRVNYGSLFNNLINGGGR